MFLTCETGRERKCRIEALDILNHYVRDDTTTPDDPTDDDGKPLSLDDEIKQLKSKRGKKQIFSAYNTGVRGTITLLCTLPDCNIVPQFRTSDTKPVHGPEAEDGNDEPEAKKSKTEEEKEEPAKPEEAVEDKEESTQSPPSWDPIATVKKVLEDLREGSATAPSSRFVTRMIPIQASCFANDAEISHAARHLFALHSDTKAATFGIQVKRRVCGHLKTKAVIELAAKEAPVTWTVNLSKPQYTLWIEICKTLCLMSIIENAKDYGKFNLVAMREQGETKVENSDE